MIWMSAFLLGVTPPRLVLAFTFLAGIVYAVYGEKVNRGTKTAE